MHDPLYSNSKDTLVTGSRPSASTCCIISAKYELHTGLHMCIYYKLYEFLMTMWASHHPWVCGSMSQSLKMLMCYSRKHDFQSPHHVVYFLLECKKTPFSAVFLPKFPRGACPRTPPSCWPASSSTLPTHTLHLNPGSTLPSDILPTKSLLENLEINVFHKTMWFWEK